MKKNLYLLLPILLLLINITFFETHGMRIYPWHFSNDESLKDLVIEAIRDERLKRACFSKEELYFFWKTSLISFAMSSSIALGYTLLGKLFKEYVTNRIDSQALISKAKNEFEAQSFIGYENLDLSQQKLIKKAIKLEESVLFTGKTGCSKSVIMKAMAKKLQEQGSSVYWIDPFFLRNNSYFLSFLDNSSDIGPIKAFSCLTRFASERGKKSGFCSYILLDDIDLHQVLQNKTNLDRLLEIVNIYPTKYVRFFATTSRKDKFISTSTLIKQFSEIELENEYLLQDVSKL